MKRWEESIAISAPADKVYAYVSDFTRHGEWSGHGLTAAKVGDGPAGVGTTFATEAKQFGTQRERSTITETSPPQKFAWDSVGALGLFHHWFSLRESGGTTTLSKGSEMAEPKFLAKMMSKKIAKDQPKLLRSDLENIKTKLEGSAG
jgi:uncharacterized membrane protein